MKPLSQRWFRLMLVLAGIVLGQALLYGPSLLGRKILLPLDILAEPGRYLPQTPEVQQMRVADPFKSDLVELFEPARVFALSQWHAGHLPVWAPYQYAGVPFVWPKFSPFLLLECAARSPVILAWVQLFAASVAGIGIYLFLRRVMSLGFWPACFGAWCYPLTGFFVLWAEFPTCGAVYWLPWLLLAVDKTVKAASPFAASALAVVSLLVLVSGHLDVAGQVLLIGGIYALWCLAETYGLGEVGRPIVKAALTLAAAWVLAFLLAAPYVLPAVEYARTGARMERRSQGEELRPPVGISALPQTVLPTMYGSVRSGSVRLAPDNEIESSEAAYSGLVATLLFAPLAWASMRRRRVTIFWAALVVFGLSWCLNIPGIVQIFRLPALNMMSHNRLVFASSFAVIALAATGLEAVLAGELRWYRWFWAPLIIVFSLGCWSLYRSRKLPDALTGVDAITLLRQHGAWWIRDPEDLHQVQSWFASHYAVSALLCGIAAGSWLLLALKSRYPRAVVFVLGFVLLGDLVWFGWGRIVQCAPELYFPAIPVLDQITKAGPGRVMGVNCLPPSYGAMCGLKDIRGYDGVDPKSFIGLMGLTADRNSTILEYAQTQWLIPELKIAGKGTVRISPVLDMLNVRYLIFRGTPPPGAEPAFQSFDYWVLTNASVLPRAFVPHQVECVPDEENRLRRLGAANFDAREFGYVEVPVELVPQCQGEVNLVSESPSRVSISFQMKTPGLVVFSELWDKGWHASLNGQSLPVLRANHALCGVVVPVGTGTLDLWYWPASLTYGFLLSGLAAVALVVWGLIFMKKRRWQAARIWGSLLPHATSLALVWLAAVDSAAYLVCVHGRGDHRRPANLIRAAGLGFRG